MFFFQYFVIPCFLWVIAVHGQHISYISRMENFGILRIDKFNEVRNAVEWIQTGIDELFFYNDANSSSECKSDLETLYNSKNQSWAMRFIDASAKLQSGILDSNSMNVGSLDECLSLNHNSSNMLFPMAPFETHICNMQVNVSVLPFLLNMFVCYPKSCNSTTIATNMNQTINKFIKGKAIQVTSDSNTCKNSDPWSIDPAASFVIFLISLMVVAVLAATIGEIVMSHFARQGRVSVVLNDDTQNPDSNKQDVSITFTKCRSNKLLNVLIILARELSLRVNMRKLFSTKKNENALHCLNGIRVISMLWVILGHVYFFGSFDFQNNSVLLKLIVSWPFQLISNAFYAVDTFFFLSGTLTSYLLLKELSNKNDLRRFNWGLLIFHRYLRLTAPYMILIAINTTLTKYWGYGPLWPEDGFDSACKGSWWANLLYLNNLLKNHRGCFGWSWYLACDFQFFLLSIIVIISYHLKPIIGHIQVIILIFTQCLYVGLMTYFNKYGPTNFLDSILHPDPQRASDYFYYLYSFPVARWTPYFMGIVLGYYLMKKNKVIKLPKSLVYAAWIFTTFIALITIFGLRDYYDHQFSVEVAALYASLCKLAWSVVLFWIILACVCGYGGMVNTFLSWSIFMPLMRLTFMAYLIHPMVLEIFYTSYHATFHVQTTLMIVLFMGISCATYFMAIFVSLFIESPLLAIERTLKQTI